MAGVASGLATRWPVAAAGAAALVLAWPALFGGVAAEKRAITRLESLRTWTESLRDTPTDRADHDVDHKGEQPGDGPV